MQKTFWFEEYVRKDKLCLIVLKEAPFSFDRRNLRMAMHDRSIECHNSEKLYVIMLLKMGASLH